MKFLLYYPMIHIPDKDYVADSIVRAMVKQRLREQTKDIFADQKVIADDLQEEIGSYHDMVSGEASRIAKKSDRLWENFTDYLQTQPPFNRVYFEGVFKKNEPMKGYLSRNEGMGRCLNHLIDSGAIFEKSEHRKHYDSSNSEAREDYVHKVIARTLQDRERGLLLFGFGHAKRFSKMLFSDKRFKFEIFDIRYGLDESEEIL